MTPPDQGGPGNPLPGFILVVALTVGTFWIGEIPLPVARPSTDEFAPDRYEEIQKYDARLWQDPFEVIKNNHDAGTRPQDSSVTGMPLPVNSSDNQNNASSSVDVSPLTDVCSTFTRQEIKQGKADITLIAAMVPGEPYAEDAEDRRRIRYAVVSGLSRSGYTPYNGRHMGLTTVSLDKAGIPVAVHVPFEWFIRKDETDKPLLLLWINESSMHKQPIHGLQEVVRNTCVCQAQSDVVVLGPTNSDTLHEMLREVGESGKGEPLSIKPRIYSPRATAEDEALLQGVDPVSETNRQNQTIEQYLTARKPIDRIAFQRTTATDGELVKALVKELGLRGVEPGDGIVLVSEWDTLYGRALPHSFRDEMCQKRDASNCDRQTSVGKTENDDDESVCNDLSICQFSYLRGLDGMLPGGSADSKAGEGGKAANKGKGSIEPVFGNQQIDYLRRIAVRIADLDQEMKNKGNKDGVKAIGVLGSDVYDKLLILRALRPRFPEAIFFTTDLDARLLHPSEWPSARNLVVAAGYGLRLNGWLQRDIPDFRDSYQTAYFLSVQLALLDSEYRRKQAMKIVARWNESPRIFEIGRSHPVDLSLLVDNPVDCDPDTCGSPHPGAHSAGKLAWYGAVPLVLLLLYWYSLNRAAVVGFLHEAKNGIGGPLRRRPGPWYRHAHWLLVDKWLWGTLLALLFIGWLGLEFDRIGRDIFITGVANGGEPFFWFEGVSIWPSVMLRVLAGLLAIYFLLRGMHRLRRDEMDITRQFFADHEKTILVHSRPILAKRLWHCLVRTRFCRVCLMGWLPRRLAGVQRRYDKAVFLWRDAVQPYTRAALIGRMLLTLLLLMAFLIPLLRLFPFEPPNTPFRGPDSHHISDHILWFAVLSFLLLLVFVIDTTRRTFRLARCLGQCVIWPDDALQKTGCADAGDHYCEEWLNIQLIAERTDVVGGFIYYPFLVLSLIIISRSPIFDNWLISPMLAIVFSFYLGVLIVCTLLLRNAAESARNNMLHSLTRKIIEARGSNDPDHRIRHMELMKEDIRDERRGAFSSYLNQPWLKAVLLPVGSYSGLQLIEYLSFLKL
jgi:hypothetical protein